MLYRRFVASFAFVCVATGGLAWNATGHMLVAQIAEWNLRTEVRLECERLLKVGATNRAYDFVTASAWADDIRPQRSETAGWHFINLHFRTDGKRVTMQPEPENVAMAIERMKQNLRDRSKPDADRADSLRFLIHFVGDIHQPLHTTARDSNEFPQGDRGGNDFKIKTPLLFSREARPPTNLHALWDRGCGLFPDVDRPLDLVGRRLIEVQANTLLASLPRFAFPAVAQQDPGRWALEGFGFSKNFVYNTPADAEPSMAYLRQGQTISAQRVTLAGYRLADLLNSMLQRPG